MLLSVGTIGPCIDIDTPAACNSVRSGVINCKVVWEKEARFYVRSCVTR